MNSFNYILNRNSVLLDILKSVDLRKINKSEINFFRNKRILITGASGMIGINLLFFFDALNNKEKTSIKVDGTYNTSLFLFVKKYFKKNKLVNFKKIDLTKKKLGEESLMATDLIDNLPKAFKKIDN